VVRTDTTEEDEMSDVTATVDTYLSAWSEPDADRRDALVRQVWAPDGTLTDPPLAAAGHEGISGMHAAMQGQYPGHRFRRASAVDAHHDRFRVGWELVDPTGTVVLSGVDVGELADDGRVRRITGFFGDLPTQ
jgi:SnoaL-like domain